MCVPQVERRQSDREIHERTSGLTLLGLERLRSSVCVVSLTAYVHRVVAVRVEFEHGMFESKVQSRVLTV